MSGAKRFMTFLIATTCAGLLYVHVQVEAVRIGYTIRKQEESKVLFLDRARALKYNIARLKAPNVLEKRLLAGRITLESPKTWQTLVLPGSPQAHRSALSQTGLGRPLFTRFFVGTAQAEAKESLN